jgi:hypothetical protein
MIENATIEWTCRELPRYREGGEQMPTKKKSSSKRQLIDTGTDKRYVRRNVKGQFKESDDVGKSLAADRRRKAKTTVPKGQGDRGDQKRAKR